MVSGVSGLVVGAEKAITLTKKAGLPKLIFVNQMDRDNAVYKKVLSQLENKYFTSIAPIQYPIIQDGILVGYVDVIANKGYKYEGKKRVDAEIPASMLDIFEQERTRIIEAAAENDDELLEKYFNGEELSVEEIIKGLLIGDHAGTTIPVMCGSALEQKGVYGLLDNILYFFASGYNKENKCVDANGNEIVRVCSENEPFSAFVFKL